MLLLTSLMTYLHVHAKLVAKEDVNHKHAKVVVSSPHSSHTPHEVPQEMKTGRLFMSSNY